MTSQKHKTQWSKFSITFFSHQVRVTLENVIEPFANNKQLSASLQTSNVFVEHVITCHLSVHETSGEAISIKMIDSQQRFFFYEKQTKQNNVTVATLSSLAQESRRSQRRHHHMLRIRKLSLSPLALLLRLLRKSFSRGNMAVQFQVHQTCVDVHV